MIHPILAISRCWLLSWLGVCPLIDEQFRLPPREAFSCVSILSNSKQFVRPPLSPGLTSFWCMSFCHNATKVTWPSERTTNDQHCIKKISCSLIMADSQLAICFRFGHRQEVHNSSSMQAIHITWLVRHELDNLRTLHRFTLKALVLPKPVWPDRQAYPWLGQGQASHPTKTVWGILDMICDQCFQPQMARDKTTFQWSLLL
jgi:hypothetical protein